MKRVFWSLLAVGACLFVSSISGVTADETLSFKILVLKTWTPPAIEGVRKCPICGTMLLAQSDREDEGAKLFDVLVNQRLRSVDSCDFIYPQADEGALFSLDDSSQNEKLKQLARKYETRAVLYPVLLRFREMVGNKYAVSSPSAVAFHIYLLDAEKLKVLWRAYYFEEQQPLSSNLLKVRLIWKRKVQWVNARRLLEDGLESAFNRFPRCGGESR